MEYRVISPATVTLSERAHVGRGALIYPCNAVLGESDIGEGCVLYPGNVVQNSEAGKNEQKPFSASGGSPRFSAGTP